MTERTGNIKTAYELAEMLKRLIRKVTAAIIGAFTKLGKDPDVDGNG